MKINDFNPQKARVLNDLIAFKWIKVNTMGNKKFNFIIPDSIHDGGGEGRLGHHYTCEALSVGPKVTVIKPGDRFVIHEYDKVDQSTPWKEDDVMFCEEKIIKLKADKNSEIFIKGKEITDKMADEYENF